MKYILFAGIILSLSFPLSGNGITESVKTNRTAQLNEGVEAYNSGDIQKAINLFSKAASSSNPGIASSAYYNHGTALAKAAENTEDQQEIPSMLEKAYQSIKRSFLLDALSKEEKINAQRNMQIIREKLLQFQDQNEQDDNSDKNEGSENSESGDSSEDKTDSDMDGQNKDESDKSDQDNTNGQQNNEDNKQDAESAAEEINEEQEMNDILDQESDNRQIRQILESKGGIYDVDKDW